ncbi:hypothetical protein [Hyphomicrobium sp. 99]|uniref:hypothetical protein n=1 Tax=Hyphomicrobium sp. 99 TaxID=1163419 RepID=UPI0005F7CB34|nr:hypothetical protein [Hyphomicrobium sp. 99]
MDILPRTLEQMELRRTRYEVQLVIGGNSRIVGYTARKTREALNEYIAKYRDEIVRHIGDPDSAYYGAGPGRIDINDDVSIAFTGRTERDARRAIDRELNSEVAA